jgi:hypothetical protein
MGLFRSSQSLPGSDTLHSLAGLHRKARLTDCTSRETSTVGSRHRAHGTLCARDTRMPRPFEPPIRQSATRRGWLELSFAFLSPLVRRLIEAIAPRCCVLSQSEMRAIRRSSHRIPSFHTLFSPDGFHTLNAPLNLISNNQSLYGLTD